MPRPLPFVMRVTAHPKPTCRDENHRSCQNCRNKRCAVQEDYSEHESDPKTGLEVMNSAERIGIDAIKETSASVVNGGVAEFQTNEGSLDGVVLQHAPD